MEGRTSSKPSWHPEDGDLVLYLDGESGWFRSLRVRVHLLRCKECLRRLGTMDAQMAILAEQGSEELDGIRRNLMAAMRAYEEGAPTVTFQVTPEVRKMLEEYVGVRMAAQVEERVHHSANTREAYDTVDRTLRLLMGGKAAASLRAKLLQEMAR
ncbi:MAG: hypothetical protein U0R19_19000 [Bryobacteraceae bacterium]